jgi:hypothetical protein
MEDTPRGGERLRPTTRIVVGVVMGCLLGVVGLPRLELPTINLQRRATPIGEPVAVQPVPTFALPPTVAVPTQTPIAIPTPTPAGPRTLFAQRFVAPLPSWPHDPEGNSWFSDGAYRLFARQPGRFVAVGVPLTEPVRDVVLTAQFHKVDGPPGGGYGFIVRDQGVSSELDSRRQSGRFIVLEVGDQGDIGVWQREQTRWIDILPWTRSAAVRQGDEPNLLRATVRGAQLVFEVNDEVVANMTYTAIPLTGGVGIFVGGDLNEVALEWLRIESL